MQGHVRKRGKGSWEYIADIGVHAAERCQQCGHRFWVGPYCPIADGDRYFLLCMNPDRCCQVSYRNNSVELLISPS